MDNVKKGIKNYPNRITKLSAFRILTGLNMRVENQVGLGEYGYEKYPSNTGSKRKNFNATRKVEQTYEENELVAIKRTQYGFALNIKKKYLRMYTIFRKLKHRTATVAEFMKKWCPSFADERISERPSVGTSLLEVGVRTYDNMEYCVATKKDNE